MADSLLITGPPASGKSRAALERFLSIPNSLLLTASATAAEHMRNQLARAGHPVRPSLVITMARFLDGRAPEAPSQGLLHRLIEDALAQLDPPRFRGVAAYRGFRQALAALLEEAGADMVGEELAALFRSVERELAVRGCALRRDRVLAAASDPGALPAHIVLDGFFSFSPGELVLLESLAQRTGVTVTLPDWAGASAARSRLMAVGFEERRLAAVHRRPQTAVFSAATMERETEEIARLILEEISRGREFRDIGIALRSRHPYASALETNLARFGIPARLYFADPMIDHPAIAFLSGIVRSMLTGWDHEALLALMRMPVSGIGAAAAGDRFDFELRKRLPGRGLPLRDIEDPPALVQILAALPDWRRDRPAPSTWAARLKTLRKLIPQPVIQGGESRGQLRIFEDNAAALDAFDEALDSAAAVLGETALTLEDFWRQMETTLALEPLRVSDRRRNVVHVMDVFEARQWELPVVFVCGMMERHFPQYHSQDPLLNDTERRRSGLPTSADRQNEERFLFELAATRATQQTILSYARFNEKGEEQLPSSFLPALKAEACEVRIRPRPRYAVAPAAPRSIEDPALLARLAKTHGKIATTQIERFLQCPFQFFAGKSLRLRPRPAAPRDRLDQLLQGTIIHRALAEWIRLPLLGTTVLDEVFEDECRRARIPATYRTEAVRLELLRNFEPFLTDRQVALNWTSRAEEPFELKLNPLLTISGRIDRIDIGPRDQALVIDYKYSAAARIRDRIEENTAGTMVQGGLYLLAAERCLGLQPAGMLYCGLRKDVAWNGWHVPVAGLEAIGETRASLADLVDAAASKAVGVFESIASGRIAPEPADTDKCRWCDFRDICRVESIARVRTAEAK